MPFHIFVKSKPKIAQPASNQLAPYREADWLVRTYAISILPSVSSLATLQYHKGDDRHRKPMIGFGNPVFQSPPVEVVSAEAESRGLSKRRRGARQHRSFSSFWSPAGVKRDVLGELAALPESEKELKTVLASLSGDSADLKLGLDASETNVKQSNLSDYRVVYFATHALVSGQVGLGEPAIALTLPATPTEQDDGLLTSSEIAMLHLDADWVVLSACDTASAEKPGAEGLSGLARSFFHAGARSLLVSSWDVDSNAAATLAAATFGTLKSDPTLTKAEALQRAMLAVLRDTTDPSHAYPDYWAPFVVVGSGTF